MIVKNRLEIENTIYRSQAIDIIEAGINSVLPPNVIPRYIKFDPELNILSIRGVKHVLKGRVFIVGGGKASGAMAETLETIITTPMLIEGIVTCKGGTYHTNKTRVVPAGHPIPDNNGIMAVHEMLNLKTKYGIGNNDTVVCLLSGGGSSLLPCPGDGVSLEDKQLVTKMMLASGAPITDVNTVRKHLSLVKGGGLGQFFAPAKVISVIISDVIGNDLSVIASGPTYPDLTTFGDALKVLEKYHLFNEIPSNVFRRLTMGEMGLIPDNPKQLTNCYNYIIADNKLALKAMKLKAVKLGLNPVIVTATQQGDPGIMAKLRANEIIERKYGSHNAIIIGGETTPILPRTHGVGGRNQHFVATSLLEMNRYEGELVVASVGTDGTDYIPDVAGAIIDKATITTIIKKKIDVRRYIEKFDSFNLLSVLGRSLIVTGETGTNVGDISLYLLN